MDKRGYKDNQMKLGEDLEDVMDSHIYHDFIDSLYEEGGGITQRVFTEITNKLWLPLQSKMSSLDNTLYGASNNK